MNIKDELSKIVSGRVIENEMMAGHTTLGVGGPADYWVEVPNEPQLCTLIKYLNSNNLTWMVIGDGANLLVSDKGIRGVVIHLVGDFEKIEIDNLTLISGSSVRISKAADIAAEHSLSGFEAVGTVPGSVGGAVVMNAGTHKGYIDEVVKSVRAVNYDGELVTLTREQCGFSYRNSRFQWDKSLILTFITFKMRMGDGEVIAKNLQDIRQHRQDSQPQGKSAGCFFKNPPHTSAGKLIEVSGCKGMELGGAAVSKTHANFIMNKSNATASQLYELAEKVRDMVKQDLEIDLEYEVRLTGEW